MESISKVIDTLMDESKDFFKDMNSRKYLIIILVIYSAFGYSMFPNVLKPLFYNPITRLLIIVGIIYLITQDTILGFLCFIAFWMTTSNPDIEMLNNYPCSSGHCEHFVDNEIDEEDEEDDDVPENSQEKAKKPVETGKKETAEEFYIPSNIDSKNIRDNFKVLHDTIHKLEKFVSEKKDK